MLIYRPLQTKGFIKEFTDTLLTMVMKYPDLSSWEISTHTSTRLQIQSPTNSPPGFPPEHSPGISTLTFTVRLEGSPLLGLSSVCHPTSKFQPAAHSRKLGLMKNPLTGSARRRLAARTMGCDHAEILCLMPAENGMVTSNHGAELLRISEFCYSWWPQCVSLYGLSVRMTLRSLLTISVDHHLWFNPCALWWAVDWTSIMWTIPRGYLQPEASKTFGSHKFFGSRGLAAAKHFSLLLLHTSVW